MGRGAPGCEERRQNMQFLLKGIISMIVTVLLQGGVASIVSTTPDDAAEDFLAGLKAGESQVMEKYMDNSYINFICNVEGDQGVVDRMDDALFQNFNYKIDKVATKDDVAVARVTVTCNDFSQVSAAYDKAAYDFINNNLYSKEVADKTALNAKCLDLYVQQIEAASSGQTAETVIYLPMVDNGYYGWDVLLSDELMQSMLGGLQMPVSQ